MKAKLEVLNWINLKFRGLKLKKKTNLEDWIEF